MSLSRLRMMGVPLQVDAKAVRLLPSDLRVFVSRLNCEAAVINGFLWDSIVPTQNPDGVPCIKLCAFGSPSRDVYFIWVYNNKTREYEMYCTPYHSRSQDCIATADAFGPILQAITFAQFIHHITFDDVTYLGMCTERSSGAQIGDIIDEKHTSSPVMYQVLRKTRPHGVFQKTQQVEPYKIMCFTCIQMNTDDLYVVNFAADHDDRTTLWVFDDIDAAVSAVNEATGMDIEVDLEIQVFTKSPDNPHQFTFSHVVALTDVDTESGNNESTDESDGDSEISVVSSNNE